MNYSAYYKTLVKKFYIERGAEELRVTRRAIERLPDVPTHIVSDASEIAEVDRTGTTVYLHMQRGAPVTRCPGTKEHVCCNYLTVDLYSGCPIGCTYCIMRSYLNFAPVSVVADPRSIIDDLRRIGRENPNIMVRAGSGETGDSLLYDPLFELSREVIEGVSDMPNVYFEVKTKTNLVEHLSSIDAKGNGVVGFSLAPQSIVSSEEGSAATLAERLEAAQEAAEAGYYISFHFDPMFYRDDWRDSYLPVVEELRRFAECVRNGKSAIAWISLGTFRFPSELKEKIAKRPYLYDELVRSEDGKYRYLQRLRREMYRDMREAILSIVRVPVYMCMESEAVWRLGFGDLPENLSREAQLFDRPEI